MKTEKGLFVVVEGPDGSGKTTTARGIRDRLVSRGIDTVLTTEPDNGVIGSFIRGTVLARGTPSMDEMTMTMLFLAARRDHCRSLIEPALSRGQVVVCDRFTLSTICYQIRNLREFFHGYKRTGDSASSVLRAASLGLPEPDITIYLRSPIEVLVERVMNRSDGKNTAYDERIVQTHAAYETALEISNQSRGHPGRRPLLLPKITEVDGNRTPAQVLSDVEGLVLARLEGPEGTRDPD